MKHMILAGFLALCAAPAFAGDRNDPSPFYRTPYAQETAKAQHRERTTAESSGGQTEHRDCAKCACHKAAEEPASAEKR